MVFHLCFTLYHLAIDKEHKHTHLRTVSRHHQLNGNSLLWELATTASIKRYHFYRSYLIFVFISTSTQTILAQTISKWGKEWEWQTISVSKCWMFGYWEFTVSQKNVPCWSMFSHWVPDDHHTLSNFRNLSKVSRIFVAEIATRSHWMFLYGAASFRFPLQTMAWTPFQQTDYSGDGIDWFNFLGSS